ncbi:hypothetical protein QE450_000889 [Paenibacillus sp. SORGH_AS306]|uniref:hypothetical protein n=1 Tax=unclassified Paenibacillus TaxID=185978 RepID=UPI00236724DE|nr:MULTISPECIES: hypothetical protein [unclassified Paenibacillus]MDQ1233391.1 hypothetical protein [Paenibacillus sp. SORGH_AS_0306]MDR6110431.1 hypothetical protein [Paenibacillus sp. SORGH_AS_0338]WDF49574.1 hypothetical protein PQ460_16360 [Paenibacillus sp. KACC 21273]
MTSTDVKHSIAGFYYQVLIACKEISLLLNNPAKEDSYVAIEYGADIRVFNEANINEKDIVIEAKFYKDSTFTRYKEAITHSIYNFYDLFSNSQVFDSSKRYKFLCNVPISEKDFDFFTNWNSNTGIDENIAYIKECFIYESVDRKPVKEGKYKEFKEKFDSNLKKFKYKKELLKYLSSHSNPEEYLFYIIPDIKFTESKLKSFIAQIDFEFPTVKIEKYESIQSLKKIISDELSKYNASFTELDKNKITLLLLEAFFDSTVNSKLRTIKVSDYKKIIENHTTIATKYLEKLEYKEMIDEIEEELRCYEIVLKENGHEELIDNVMSLLIELKEQLYTHIDQFSMNSTMKKFIMNNKNNYPLEVIKLFQSMAEMMTKTKKNIHPISIISYPNLNNIKIGENLNFSLRAVPSASSKRKSSKLMLTSFIDHTRENLELTKAIGGEIIIFNTDSKICQLSSDIINNTVIDICKIPENVKYQELYKSFRYKCTECLELSYRGQCPFIKELMEE